MSSRRITNGRFVLFSSFKSTPSEKWNHRTFNAKIVIFLYGVCACFFFGHSFGWLFSNEFLVNFVCIWNDVIYVHQNAFALSFYPFDSGQCQTQIMLLMMMMMVYAHSVIKYERELIITLFAFDLIAFGRFGRRNARILFMNENSANLNVIFHLKSNNPFALSFQLNSCINSVHTKCQWHFDEIGQCSTHSNSLSVYTCFFLSLSTFSIDLLLMA